MTAKERKQLEAVKLLMAINDRVNGHLSAIPDKGAAMNQIVDALATVNTDEEQASFMDAAEACEKGAAAFMHLAASCWYAAKRVAQGR